MNLNSVIIKYHRELNRLRIAGKTNHSRSPYTHEKAYFFVPVMDKLSVVKMRSHCEGMMSRTKMWRNFGI